MSSSLAKNKIYDSKVQMFHFHKTILVEKRQEIVFCDKEFDFHAMLEQVIFAFPKNIFYKDLMMLFGFNKGEKEGYSQEEVDYIREEGEIDFYGGAWIEFSVNEKCYFKVPISMMTRNDGVDLIHFSQGLGFLGNGLIIEKGDQIKVKVCIDFDEELTRQYSGAVFLHFRKLADDFFV